MQRSIRGRAACAARPVFLRLGDYSMIRSRIRLVAALALAVGVAGCGDNKPPPGAPIAKTYPVHGQVTLPDKSPLRGGIVYFTPVEVKAGSKLRYEGAGQVDAKGQFAIGLNGNGAGVAAGDYKVTVAPRDYMELRNSNSSRIPPAYRDKMNTPLTITVKEDDNVVNLALKQ